MHVPSIVTSAEQGRVTNKGPRNATGKSSRKARAVTSAVMQRPGGSEPHVASSYVLTARHLIEHAKSDIHVVYNSMHSFQSRVLGFFGALSLTGRAKASQVAQEEGGSNSTRSAPVTSSPNPRSVNNPEPRDLSTKAQSSRARLLDQPLLTPFLETADRLEILYATLVSDLCNMAYDVSKVDDSRLQVHQLQLVCSSGQPLYGPITREMHWEQVKAAQSAGTYKLPSQELKPITHSPGTLLHIATTSVDSIVHASPHALGSSLDLKAPELYSGSDIVYKGTPDIEYSLLMSSMEEMLNTFESMDSYDESSMSLPLHASLEFSGYPVPHGLDSMVSADEFTPGASLEQIMNPSEVKIPRTLGGFRPAPISAGVVASGHMHSAMAASEPHSPQASNLIQQPAPPAAWFVADDTVTKVRYFIIQGSTSMEHWAINVNFEPVLFENPSLGARVHRGVYEAALRLYDELLPLIRQHIASSPHAKICLGGHSLGGSLATVLMLLLVHRKVTKATALSPCFTYGAPAVFCAGASSEGPEHALDAHGSNHRCDSCQLNCPEHTHSSEKLHGPSEPHKCNTENRPLMARLGISEDLLTNVMMHKDIVPRAFVCDYTAFAGLLKHWMPSFKDHSRNGLEHKSLYNFLGRMAILRPDDDAPFVVKDAHHPMLPDVAGLYKLRDPRRITHLSDSFDALSSMEIGHLFIRHDQQHHSQQDALADEESEEPMNLRRALLQFMNYPHPLQSLSVYASYGTNGSISRYHNPDNYTKGLSRLAAGCSSSGQGNHFCDLSSLAAAVAAVTGTVRMNAHPHEY